MRRACQSSRCDTSLMALEDRDSCALDDIPELFLRMVVLIQVAASGAISQMRSSTSGEGSVVAAHSLEVPDTHDLLVPSLPSSASASPTHRSPRRRG
jgi:hypothetical protein